MMCNSVPSSVTLALLLASSTVFAVDKIKRVSATAFESTGYVDASTYVGNSQSCFESLEETKKLGVNHGNSSSLNLNLMAFCENSTSYGWAFAASELESSLTAKPYVNQSLANIDLSAEAFLSLELSQTSGGSTNNPQFGAEGTVNIDSVNSSNFKSLPSQSRTLTSSYELSADYLEGICDLEAGSYVNVLVKGSSLSAVYMGGYWVVFGDLEDSTTQHPNSSSRSIFFTTAQEGLFVMEYSTEVVAGQSQFVGKVEMGDVSLQGATSQFGSENLCQWEVAANASFHLAQ